MDRPKYDAIIIGAGPGGYSLALECGRRGMKIALVEERESLGGTCLNIGCIPSKALLESSEFFHRVGADSTEHGIILPPGPISPDLAAMMARKDSVIKQLTGGLSALMKARSVDVIRGRGIVMAPGKVEVRPNRPDSAGQGAEGAEAEAAVLTAKSVVMASGSVPAAIPQLPFDGKRVVDSTGALAFTSVPKSLAVVGGGAVGLELGSVWKRLGTKVTIIEALERIVPDTDTQASRTLTAALTRQGIEIRTGTRVEGAKVTSRSVILNLSSEENPNDRQGGKNEISVEKVLVAAGRRACMDSALGPNINPRRTEDGRFIKVDENFATSIDGLFAIGDLIGNPMLAHKAAEDALALAALLAGEPRAAWGGPIPGIVYTEPELAWAGETEDSLKKAGGTYEKGLFPFSANGRALASGAVEGFVKLLSSPGDGKLLGAVIVGRGASELIAEAVSVMAFGGSAEDIALTVHGHPTLAEANKEAALALLGRPMHRS